MHTVVQRRRRGWESAPERGEAVCLSERRGRVLKNARAEKDGNSESRRQRDNSGKSNRGQWRRDKRWSIRLVIAAGREDGDHAFVARLGRVWVNAFVRVGRSRERNREEKGGEQTETRERAPRSRPASNEAKSHALRVWFRSRNSQGESRKSRKVGPQTALLFKRTLICR